jgi:transposase
LAQEKEFPDVIQIIGRFVDLAVTSLSLPPRIDAVGQAPFPEDELAKLVLAQQYIGKSNRVSIGMLTMFKQALNIHDRWSPSYKTLERAYGDADVIAILNEAFFLTQEPVKDLEHNFMGDGTCFPASIKVNWESSKDEILKISGKQTFEGAKERKKHQFEKAVIVAGSTFKIISSFARAKTSVSHESPYLKKLLKEVGEFYALVAMVCLDSGFLSRENCDFIEKEIGAKPRIFPKKGVTLKARGSQPWKDMLLEFVNYTQSWLREYHKRSIIETINSTMKRTLPYAIKKKLVERKTTEMLAKIIVYNIRQLVYLHYTKGIDTGVSTEPRQVTLSDWMKP